jgi:hypothetical protein
MNIVIDGLEIYTSKLVKWLKLMLSIPLWLKFFIFILIRTIHFGMLFLGLEKTERAQNKTSGGLDPIKYGQIMCKKSVVGSIKLVISLPRSQ